MLDDILDEQVPGTVVGDIVVGQVQLFYVSFVCIQDGCNLRGRWQAVSQHRQVDSKQITGTRQTRRVRTWGMLASVRRSL